MPVLLLLALTVQGTGPTREERVLALLEEVAGLGSYRYQEAVFESVAQPAGAGPVVAPVIMVSCGNADDGTFDDVRVRRLACELCAVYGLEVQADRFEVEGACSVVLDGLDPVARIGFELRGLGCRETFCEVQAEEPAVALDDSELAWLMERGYRLHVADVARYRGYGDELTPTLAYAAGFVRFLDDVTEGEDVELGGLLFEREKLWRLQSIPAACARNFGSLDVDHNVTLVFPCRGLPDFEAAPDRDPLAGFRDTPLYDVTASRKLVSTAGAPSVLHLLTERRRESPSETAPEVRMRVRQWRGGVERIHESRSFTAFLPGAFDLAEPFDLELDLTPGTYFSFGIAKIGGAASCN